MSVTHLNLHDSRNLGVIHVHFCGFLGHPSIECPATWLFYMMSARDLAFFTLLPNPDFLKH